MKGSRLTLATGLQKENWERCQRFTMNKPNQAGGATNDVAGPVVDGEEEVVAGQGAGNGIAAGSDRLNGILGGAMLEHDLQAWKPGMKMLEGGQESALGIEDGQALLVVAWELAVQVENQATGLHGGKDGVEGLVGDDARGGVCRDAGRIALDADDAGLLGLINELGGGGFVEVEDHEVVERGVESLQAGLVLQGLGDADDGRHEVGHHVDGVDAAAADRGHDGGRHGAVPEVDVEIGRRGELKRSEGHAGREWPSKGEGVRRLLGW